jgi:predicted anti-sigma-YlaC factor YlaD
MKMTMTAMIDIIYVLVVLLGCIAAFDWKGRAIRNRTALVLVGSAGVAAALPLIGVPFDPLLWTSIDLAVVVLLMQPKYSVSDALIVTLFVAIWPTYTTNDPTAIMVGTALVIVQFLLAIGAPALCVRIARRFGILSNPNEPLQMLAAA